MTPLRVNKARTLIGEYPRDDMADVIYHEAVHQILEQFGQTRRPNALKLAGIDTRDPALNNGPMIDHLIRIKLV